jgi:NADH-quinone oxidoreductase subunit J
LRDNRRKETLLELFPLVFYILSIGIIISSLGVILITSPIYSALFLAITMTLLSAIFFMLEAYFVAAIQLMVYAGAVVVLFVMVLMLFDLRKEKESFSGTWRTNLVKTGLSAIAFLILAVPVGIILTQANLNWLKEKSPVTKDLSMLLFEKYLFTFEIVGVLLLVVLVGSVTLAKSKGGTHAKHHD